MLHRRTLAILLVAAASASAQPQTEAVYRVTFQATWSAETHPQSFPANAHFSWLIGGTHDAAAEFWAPGQPASPGIESMAETGGTAALASEVEDQIALGHAGEVVRSLSFPFSPGSVDATFTVTSDHPLLTLTTMVAPSPDWFVGVRGLDLRDRAGWLPEWTVDLYPWDAGTDSGPTYTSPDQDTQPAQPITAIAGAPFTPGVPLGRFVFELVSQTTDVPDVGVLAATAYPNPFNPRTTVAFAAPQAGRASVVIHDPRGRRVRTLLDGEVAAGRTELTWDGLDDGGRALSGGVYLVRVRSGAAVGSVRLSLIR